MFVDLHTDVHGLGCRTWPGLCQLHEATVTSCGQALLEYFKVCVHLNSYTTAVSDWRLLRKTEEVKEKIGAGEPVSEMCVLCVPGVLQGASPGQSPGVHGPAHHGMAGLGRLQSPQSSGSIIFLL